MGEDKPPSADAGGIGRGRPSVRPKGATSQTDRFGPVDSGATEPSGPTSETRSDPAPVAGFEGLLADAAFDPDPAGPAESVPTEDEGLDYDIAARQTSCLVIGPSNAGKTTMLCALNEVAGVAARGGPRVEVSFDLSSPDARELKTYWYDILLGRRKPRGSTDDRFYEASVEVRVPGMWRDSVHAAHLKFHDGPGGALFPSGAEEGDWSRNEDAMARFRDSLLEAGRRARTLVLCVGVPAVDKAVDAQLLANLGAALDQLAVVERPRSRGAFTRLTDLLRGRPIDMTPRQRPRKLRCDRFLLLVNKVDQLCLDAVDDPDLRIDRVAENLDPVGQAIAMLGPALMRKIRSRLRDDALFAVGLMSATGFDTETGRPLFDRAGAQVRTSDAVSVEEMLPRIQPFGLVEALTFMVTGRCYGPVALVPDAILDEDLLDVRHRVGATVLHARIRAESEPGQESA